MNRLSANRSDWPTKGYIHQAINVLERIGNANGHVSAIPMDCRPASWRFPQLAYDILNCWFEDKDRRIALLGFPQSPAAIMLGWILERSRMGGRELTALNLQDLDFARLTVACGYLPRRKILVQSSGFADAGSFYAQVQRIAAEFGATRVLAHDGLLRSGMRLSESPIPQGWEEVSDFLDVEVVLCGRHDPGVQEQPSTAGPSSRGTVLLVDDLEEVRDCLKIILTHWGFEVLEAGTSEEALRVAGGVCVDLMISDVNRPGMNGIDFLPVFKQLHPNTPVILVSACLFDEVRIKATRAGAAALLDKPFQLAELRNVIEQAGLSLDQGQ